jgi:hypothetical protein
MLFLDANGKILCWRMVAARRYGARQQGLDPVEDATGFQARRKSKMVVAGFARTFLQMTDLEIEAPGFVCGSHIRHNSLKYHQILNKTMLIEDKKNTQIQATDARGAYFWMDTR